MRISPQDQAKVADAIVAAEATTDGEINAIVARSSDSYADVVLHYALLAGLLPLAIAAAWPQALLFAASRVSGWEEPSLRLALTLLIGASILLFLIVRYVAGIDRLRVALTPGGTRERRVRRRAIMLFRAGTEQRTASRTGVLLYLSLAERRAEIVADAAIHARAPEEQWGEAMAALVEAMHDGRPGNGMAAAITRIGAVLAEHFPFTGTDPNEMPDRLIEL